MEEYRFSNLLLSSLVTVQLQVLWKNAKTLQLNMAEMLIVLQHSSSRKTNTSMMDAPGARNMRCRD